MKKYFLPPLIWMIFLFFLSSRTSLPGAEIMWADVVFKKTAHFGVYLILCLTWWWTFWQIEKKNGRQFPYKWWLIPLLCLFFAASDEIHQSFVAGRSARVYDVWIDSLGIFSAWLWCYRFI